MRQEQLKKLKTWFNEFVSSFYTDSDTFLNENIRLKEQHTHRVCNEIRQLAAALKMNESDTLLAETIALLHDVGRFPQFQKYRTYKDDISTNHSLLALSVIGEHRLLDDVEPDQREIIEKAIEFHGAKDLPVMDERLLHFTRMIRDADKIDIFELLVKNYRILAREPQKFKVELEFPDKPQYSPEILQAVIQRQTIDYRKLKTINDAKLLQIGWVYDINFDHSLHEIYKRGYVQAVVKLLPDTPEIRQAADAVIHYMRERIEKCI